MSRRSSDNELRGIHDLDRDDVYGSGESHRPPRINLAHIEPLDDNSRLLIPTISASLKQKHRVNHRDELPEREFSNRRARPPGSGGDNRGQRSRSSTRPPLGHSRSNSISRSSIKSFNSASRPVSPNYPSRPDDTQTQRSRPVTPSIRGRSVTPSRRSQPVTSYQRTGPVIPAGQKSARSATPNQRSRPVTPTKRTRANASAEYVITKTVSNQSMYSRRRSSEESDSKERSLNPEVARRHQYSKQSRERRRCKTAVPFGNRRIFSNSRLDEARRQLEMAGSGGDSDSESSQSSTSLVIETVRNNNQEISNTEFGENSDLKINRTSASLNETNVFSKEIANAEFEESSDLKMNHTSTSLNEANGSCYLDRTLEKLKNVSTPSGLTVTVCNVNSPRDDDRNVGESVHQNRRSTPNTSSPMASISSEKDNDTIGELPVIQHDKYVTMRKSRAQARKQRILRSWRSAENIIRDSYHTAESTPPDIMPQPPSKSLTEAVAELTSPIARLKPLMDYQPGTTRWNNSPWPNSSTRPEASPPWQERIMSTEEEMRDCTNKSATEEIDSNHLIYTGNQTEGTTHNRENKREAMVDIPPMPAPIQDSQTFEDSDDSPSNQSSRESDMQESSAVSRPPPRESLLHIAEKRSFDNDKGLVGFSQLRLPSPEKALRSPHRTSFAEMQPAPAAAFGGATLNEDEGTGELECPVCGWKLVDRRQMYVHLYLSHRESVPGEVQARFDRVLRFAPPHFICTACNFSYKYLIAAISHANYFHWTDIQRPLD